MPRTAEAAASVIVDPLTTRSMAVKVEAASVTTSVLIAADTSDSVPPIAVQSIAVLRIGAVADTGLISPLAGRADMVTASCAAVVDRVVTTLSVAVLLAGSVMSAAVLAVPLRIIVAASAIRGMVVELSDLTSVVGLLISAIQDTVVVVAVDTCTRASPAADIEGMVPGAMSPASIARRAGAASPIVLP